MAGRPRTITPPETTVDPEVTEAADHLQTQDPVLVTTASFSVTHPLADHLGDIARSLAGIHAELTYQRVRNDEQRQDHLTRARAQAEGLRRQG